MSVLFSGDDFGKLSLVSDAPRAATIICREPTECLVIFKTDFNRYAVVIIKKIQKSAGCANIFYA